MVKFSIIATFMAMSSIFSIKALSQTQIFTISSILNNPIDGQEVTLIGRIIHQEPGEKDYILTDGTDEIIVEIQDNNFSYNPDTTVEILGTVNFESQHLEEAEEDPTPEELEINVNQLRVVN